MADLVHLEILGQGVEVWNRWRQQYPHIRPELHEADLYGAWLSVVNLSEADLSSANLRSAYLAGAHLTKADLSRAQLSNAHLRRADLKWASLAWADLSGADLSEAFLGQASLSNVNLNLANLRWANLCGADLSRASLFETNLHKADLGGVGLNEADLGGAVLSRANLRGADLSRANLAKAFLIWANLTNATLDEANVSEAIVGDTIFAQVNLRVVKGLESIEHMGPSIIDIDTIYRSGGKIPEAFLRGCGVPDTFIAYAASLTGEAIQYYSCFISYSSKDEAFAQRLHADLQDNGVRCWFAPEDIKIGDEIRPRIQESIKGHDKLLVVLSEHSINSSWVEDEVETAFEEESRRKKTVLFPIRLDATVMETDQAWAAKIRRTRHVGDFSRWKDHNSYQQAFARLLDALKAPTP